MLGAKITDLFLAEKNLVDFVDKNLGQEWDRLKQDELEMDSVCNHLVGGTLDYPVKISHDFCDITTAWDIYINAFTRDVRQIIPKRFGFGVNEKPTSKNHRWAKMPFRGDELTPKQFVNAICHCGPKIRNHIIDCTMEVTQTGRLENLYPIISNVVVIRNYIWVFQQVFDPESKNKLKPEYKQFCDLVEVISEQMLQVQANLLLTFIAHDEDSQNWGSHHPYYEGERGSPIIQMWSYFLQSMQRDMWKIMPPQLAQRILGIITSDSLAILVSRYSRITPIEASIPQFVCDIANILATVEELLFFICTDLTLVCGEADPAASKSIYSIHLKCTCLATSLVIVGCPLEILYKCFRRGLSSCTLMDKKPVDVSKLSEPVWMEITRRLCPKFYPTSLSLPDWELLFSLKLVCSQPAPNWPLIYRVVTMQDCKIAGFILSLFPTVVAPVCDFMLEGKAFQRCGNASCMSSDCHSLAKSLPNHYAAACTLYIVAHAKPRDMFVKVYRPVLIRIVDWSVMDKTQMWNSKSRPVWFQSLIDLLLPILKTCVQSLCLSIFAMDKLQHCEDTYTQLVIELLNVLTEILSVLPRGFFLVCEEMDDMIPPTYQPVRNNVPVHFLVTALYMLLNLGPKIAYIPPPPPQEEGSDSSSHDEATPRLPTVVQGNNKSSEKKEEPNKLLEPVLLSVAERLCHLDDAVFDQSIHRLVSQIESMMKQMRTHAKNKENLSSLATECLEDYAMDWDMANLKADFLLEEVEGQLALRVVYWFVITHGDVLQDMIGGDVNNHGNKLHVPASKLSTSSGTTITGPLKPAVSSVNTAQPASNSSMPAENSSRFQPQAKLNFNLLKIAPRIRTYIKPKNVIHEFHFVNKYRLFDEIIWNNSQNMDWVKTVRFSRLGLHKALILKQLERRWEFQQQNTVLDVSGAIDVTSDKRNFTNKMVEEMKALMMT